MPRPPKKRNVEYVPEVTHFKPAGVPLRELEENTLTIEELEAIRLKDVEGLDQQGGADRMQVSRTTFQYILSSARSKIADSLVYGKSIKIEGGTYELGRSEGRRHRHRHGPG